MTISKRRVLFPLILIISSALFRFSDAANTYLSETPVFRDKQHTYNSRYEFRIYDNKLQMRALNSGKEWEIVPLHKKQKTITKISVDDRGIIAVDTGRYIFYSFNALKDIDQIKWTDKWGFPFGKGPRMHLPKDTLAWDISVASVEEDKYYLAPNGNRYRLGEGCTSVFILYKQGRRIAYLDPWLHSDLSYRVGMPERGRFIAKKMSASGSALFVIGEYGTMYTRDFDFDRSGADTLFFNFSYDPVPFMEKYAGKIVPNSVPMPLPQAGWRKQPRINGIITDRITIVKKGIGLVYKDLYVEGRQGNQIGYFRKDVSDEDWTFTAVPGAKLQGNILKNNIKDSVQKSLGAFPGITYKNKNHNLPFAMPLNFKRVDYVAEYFDPFCSPNELKIIFDQKEVITLILHTAEKIRILRRNPEISNRAFKFQADIEIPDKILSNIEKQPPAVREYIGKILRWNKHTRAGLSVTKSRLKIYTENFYIKLSR